MVKGQDHGRLSSVGRPQDVSLRNKLDNSMPRNGTQFTRCRSEDVCSPNRISPNHIDRFPCDIPERPPLFMTRTPAAETGDIPRRASVQVGKKTVSVASFELHGAASQIDHMQRIRRPAKGSAVPVKTDLRSN